MRGLDKLHAAVTSVVHDSVVARMANERTTASPRYTRPEPTNADPPTAHTRALTADDASDQNVTMTPASSSAFMSSLAPGRTSWRQP